MKLSNPTKTYRADNTKVYSCIYHVIFTPKYRRSVLVDGIDERLKEIVVDVCSDHNSSVVEMEVMPDHVHLLLDVDPDVGVSTIIRRIKGASSRILREEFPQLKSRLPSLWTRSKFVSSVGSVSLETVKQYIADQKGV